MLSSLYMLAGLSAVHAYTVLDHEQFMTKNIDALVLPGTYSSHLHAFFGSDAITNVKATSADLQKGCYSGDNGNDLSVYWIPLLFHVEGDKHTEIKPSRFSTYYHIESAQVPFPPDFAAIAGSAKATTQADVDEANNDMSWFCEYGYADGSSSEAKDGAKFPTKTCAKGRMQTILRFPDCVDLNNLSNYTYHAPDKRHGTDSRCPVGMERIPQLRFSVRYAVPGEWEGTAPFQLACGEVGDGYCFHGDFINGWYDDAAQNMLDVASDKREFAQVTGEHGKGGEPRECTPTDADPENGTSDYQTSLEMMKAGVKRGGVRKSLAEKRAAM